MRLLSRCQKCGQEYGAGEEDHGRSPCCLAEGDPEGEVEEDENAARETLRVALQVCPRCGQETGGNVWEEPCPFCPTQA